MNDNTPAAELTGRLVQWDQKKGFGFLQAGQQRVFLHYREFTERPRPPVVGEKIRFVLGQDAQGRTCARKVGFVRAAAPIGMGALVVLSGLLVLPALAVWQHGLDYRWAAGYALAVSALTYAVYGWDKRRALEGEWRVAEARLHLLESLGGWPGAFLAQRRLRHKCSKLSFQFVFWLIVLAHQFAAVDSLQNWHFTRSALERLEAAWSQRK